MKRINNLKASLTKTLLLILSVCTTAAMIISANSVVRGCSKMVFNQFAAAPLIDPFLGLI